LRALKKSFFSDDRVRMQQGRIALDADWVEPSALTPPITFAEKLGTCLLIAATLGAGLYPKLLLDRIMPAVETMRFLQP
jgi:NADH:ubiquinone oxidoreductase subunit 4 (subunit M)